MIPDLIDWLFDMITKKYRGFYNTNGEKINFRLLQENDVDLLVDFYNNLSEETRYLRFQFHTESLPPEKIREYAALFCQPKAGKTFAIVATICRNEKEAIVGVIRYAKENEGDNEAEFAITIRDDFQKQKIGTRLLKLLIREAQDTDIDYLTGTIMASNMAIIKLLKNVAPRIQFIHEGGQSQVRLDVRNVN